MYTCTGVGLNSSLLIKGKLLRYSSVARGRVVESRAMILDLKRVTIFSIFCLKYKFKKKSIMHLTNTFI